MFTPAGGKPRQNHLNERLLQQGIRQVLFNPRHQAMVRQRHAAGSGRQRAVQHLQQGTFAAAVMADQADAVAFFQGKGEVGEKRPECRFNMQRLRAK